jgi:hypothetical protein
VSAMIGTLPNDERMTLPNDRNSGRKSWPHSCTAARDCPVMPS